MEVIVSGMAQQDISKYGKYLLKEVSSNFAKDFSLNMTNQLNKIAVNPYIGNSDVSRFTKSQEIRYFLYRKYRMIIFYEVQNTQILIVRVLNMSMNVSNILNIQP